MQAGEVRVAHREHRRVVVSVRAGGGPALAGADIAELSVEQREPFRHGVVALVVKLLRQLEHGEVMRRVPAPHVHVALRVFPKLVQRQRAQKVVQAEAVGLFIERYQAAAFEVREGGIRILRVPHRAGGGPNESAFEHAERLPASAGFGVKGLQADGEGGFQVPVSALQQLEGSGSVGERGEEADGVPALRDAQGVGGDFDGERQVAAQLRQLFRLRFAQPPRITAIGEREREVHRFARRHLVEADRGQAAKLELVARCDDRHTAVVAR